MFTEAEQRADRQDRARQIRHRREILGLSGYDAVKVTLLRFRRDRERGVRDQPLAEFAEFRWSLQPRLDTAVPGAVHHGRERVDIAYEFIGIDAIGREHSDDGPAPLSEPDVVADVEAERTLRAGADDQFLTTGLEHASGSDSEAGPDRRPARTHATDPQGPAACDAMGRRREEQQLGVSEHLSVGAV